LISKICTGLKASTLPWWLKCLASGNIGGLGSCLTKLKNELHGQRSLEIVKFIKWKNESSHGKGWILRGLTMTLLHQTVFIHQGEVLTNFIC
jgi:hypothetical protein